ncbi:ribonuclease H-like domain-containing protein [Tanacetum coccineum]
MQMVSHFELVMTKIQIDVQSLTTSERYEGKLLDKFVTTQGKIQQILHAVLTLWNFTNPTDLKLGSSLCIEFFSELCRLGKHVKLPFHSSDSIVEHCFDIILSDLWTSPILFKHKFHADGTLSRYKARLVANGSSQQLGVDFDETFSSFVKLATIRTVLSLAVPRRSLYGLKQAPRAWFQRFAGYATRVGFYHSRFDSSLFIYRQLYVSATTSPVGYTDADWAAKRQHTLSRSSAKAEYHGVANVVSETAWLRNLSTATLIYCDNVSAIYMSSNPVQHQWTKHIEIDIHFSQVRVLHVSSRYQYANIFTKGLPSVFLKIFDPD